MTRQGKRAVASAVFFGVVAVVHFFALRICAGRDVVAAALATSDPLVLAAAAVAFVSRALLFFVAPAAGLYAAVVLTLQRRRDLRG